MNQQHSLTSTTLPPIPPERLARFLDIQIELVVELGRKNMAIGDLLQLREGSVLQFPAQIEESMPMLANGVTFGRCDLVPGNGPINIRVASL